MRNRSFGVPVLKQVSLEVHAGTTLGLVGENGAGKSTLMNILGGNLRADAGTMRFTARNYSPISPRDAELAGIAFIHQELNLFPNLTIAENIFLVRFPRQIAWIDRAAMRRKTAGLLRQVGLDMSPNQKVESLSAGERQLVEIAKALNLDARLIILDEPTTSLTTRETERLFAILDSLRSAGIAMIYISHALSDVQRIVRSDRRSARWSSCGKWTQRVTFNSNDLISRMVGREVDQQFPQRTHQAIDKTVLRLDKVSQPGMVEKRFLSEFVRARCWAWRD